MYNINLDTDWFRNDLSSITASYYGYALPDTAEDESGWAIRRITTTGPSMSTADWSNKLQLLYTSKWSEREAYFVSASQSISLTYSVSNPSDDKASIYVSWNDIDGMDTYTTTFEDHNGVVYNNLFERFKNPYIATPYTAHIVAPAVSGGTVSYLFRGKTGMTYSVSVIADNKFYSVTASTVITT